MAKLIELEPGYCDVIVRRWEEFTGREVTHSETGEKFTQLSETRQAAPKTSSTFGEPVTQGGE